MRRVREEEGSILPMTALLVVVVLGFTAFAVDLGLNRVAVRDMQALADAAALDAARALPSCDATALTTRANTTKSRHGRVIGDSSPLVAQAGNLDATGRFVPNNGGTSCSAVRITAATTVDFAFAPVIGTDSGSATRRAVGTRSDPAVCFSAGTKAIALDTSQSGLGPLLDRIIRVNNLNVAGYTGLVDLKSLNVPLADLDAALSAGTGTGLIDTTTITLQQFLVASATALRKGGGPGAVAQATLLESMAARAGGLSLNIADILDLSTDGGGSALDAAVNAIDLITVGIVAANGENALQVNQLGIALPLDLVDSRTRLVVVEPPRIACGGVGATARTAQVRLEIVKGINAVGLTEASLRLGVEVAQGSAVLKSIRCGAPQSTSVQGTTGAARVIGVGADTHASLAVRLLLLTLADIRINGDVGSNTTTQDFPFPPAPDLKQHFGGTTRIILKAEAGGLVGALSPLLNPVLDTVNALTGTLDLLLRPVLALLGIQVGSMDVMMLGKPTCSNVRLSG